MKISNIQVVLSDEALERNVVQESSMHLHEHRQSNGSHSCLL